MSHSFIHHPFFVNAHFNTAFSLVLSTSIGFSQAMYDFVHMRHHSGNMDRPDADGNTTDYLSIYKYGKNGQPENLWRYTFLSFFRDDPFEYLQIMAKRRPGQAKLAKVELAVMIAFYLVLGALNWKFILCMLPFYYIGHCLSSLNGFYEHFGGNPDKPIAWGVSTYGRFYNWSWLNNGFHAEHHYRPSVHWSELPALHRSILPEQAREGTKVINLPHPLGFWAKSN